MLLYFFRERVSYRHIPCFKILACSILLINRHFSPVSHTHAKVISTCCGSSIYLPNLMTGQAYYFCEITSKQQRLHKYNLQQFRRLEELVYASVPVKRLNDNITEDGKCADSERNADALANHFTTTDTDKNNNKHSISAELGTAITTPIPTSSAYVRI